MVALTDAAAAGFFPPEQLRLAAAALREAADLADAGALLDGKLPPGGEASLQIASGAHQRAVEAISRLSAVLETIRALRREERRAAATKPARRRRP